MYTTLVILLLVFPAVLFGQELLVNPGFEQPLDGSDWECWGNCDLSQDADAHTGSYSGKITNRDELWKTPMQYVPLVPASTYYFECWIKLLNIQQGFLYHTAELKLQLNINETETRYTVVSIQPHLTPERGWVKLSGDFFTGNTEFEQAKVYIQVDNVNAEYLVDTASLTKLILNPDWKTEANTRIESIRKSDVTISLEIGGNYEPELVTVEVTQTRHHFAFGSAAREDQMIGTDEDSVKYRQCFFENFQWSVFHNAHKWPQMEWKRDQIVYPDEAFAVLRGNGIPMRGHCLFWNRADRLPTWVPPLSAEETMQELTKRMNYTLPHYKGEVLHWDVNNEQVHNDFFENKAGDNDILTKIFKEARTFDEDVLLFLNDYHVVNNGNAARALANSAYLLLSQDAPLGGIGVQGHLEGPVTLDLLTSYQKRLDTVIAVGLPVWVTEMDIIGINSPTELADAYDDVLTLFYSNPSIEGVILWGFSDLHHWRPEAALFEGPDYEPNASGLRWQEIVGERWRTTATFTASSAQETFGFRGFHGSYNLQVKYEGVVIQEQTFSFEKEDVTIDISV